MAEPPDKIVFEGKRVSVNFFRYVPSRKPWWQPQWWARRELRRKAMWIEVSRD